jgi:hypothetical protein
VINSSHPFPCKQDLFDLVYGDGSSVFLRHFHTTVNKDPHASVGEWVGDSRVISFNAPVDAPGVIKRLVGSDTIRVVETLRRAYAPDGSITLVSCAMLLQHTNRLCF